MDEKSVSPLTEKPSTKKRYEKPAIAWEEKYEPVGFGISCAHEGGNPECMVGPILT